MNASRSLPPSLRAQRVLLWVIAALMFMNAVSALLESGEALFGMGYALPYVLLGVLCSVGAVRLPRAERWVRVAVITVHVLLLLGEIGRFAGGDLRAIIGVLFPTLGLVLIFRRSARRFADSAR